MTTRALADDLTGAIIFEVLGHDLRVLLRWSAGRADQPTAVIIDNGPRQSTLERGHRAAYDEHKKRKGTKIHAAVDTLGEVLVRPVTPANARERVQIAALAEDIQTVNGQTVEVAFVAQGIRLEVIKLPEPRGVACCHGAGSWSAPSPGRRFQRLAKADERLPETVAGRHVVPFACLMLHRLVTVAAQSP